MVPGTEGPGPAFVVRESALLGKDTGTKIAARLGCLVSQICVRHQEMGIPNFYWMKRIGRERILGDRKD